jgi:hypothetical protein
LSTHLYHGLPGGLFPSSFPTNPICIPLLPHSCYMPCPFILAFVIVIILGEEYKSWTTTTTIKLNFNSTLSQQQYIYFNTGCCISFESPAFPVFSHVLLMTNRGIQPFRYATGVKYCSFLLSFTFVNCTECGIFIIPIFKCADFLFGTVNKLFIRWLQYV